MGDKIRCVLVLGGPQEEWIHEAPPLQADDLIIACDSGYPAALTCGWNPQMAVGDFDSYCGQIAPHTRKISELLDCRGFGRQAGSYHRQFANAVLAPGARGKSPDLFREKPYMGFTGGSFFPAKNGGLVFICFCLGRPLPGYIKRGCLPFSGV